MLNKQKNIFVIIIRVRSYTVNIDSTVFYSNDINNVVDFYRDIIGLTVEYQQSDKYVSFLFENGVRLGIKRAAEEREIPGAQTIFIASNDIEILYEKFQRRGVIISKELQLNDGFGLNFSILDPDNNKVQFVDRNS